MGIGNSFKGYEAIFAALRMVWQMLYRLFIVIFIIQIIIVSLIIYYNHDTIYGNISAEDICLFRAYSISKLTYKFNPNRNMIKVEYPCEGQNISLNYGYFMDRFEPYIIARADIIKSKTLNIIVWTSFLYLLLPLLLIYFNNKHKRDSKDKFIRGATIVSADELQKMISEKSQNEFKFRITEHIQIPMGIINRHCITLGRPGTGKTQLVIRIIEQLIKNGFRAIIHDFKGDFITTFYDYRKHYIFNPLDKRHMGLKDFEMELIKQCEALKVSDLNDTFQEKYANKLTKISVNEKIQSVFEYTELLDIINEIVENIKPDSKHFHVKNDKNSIEIGIKGWSIFNELKSSIDIDAFCASLIPESASQDNFWPISSRQLLGSIITYCIHNNIKTYSELWRLVNLGNEQLLELFKNTAGCEEGTKLLTEAKTANNILAVMSNYTKPIKYLIGTEGSFSIKDWVKDSKSDRKIIFLSNYAMIQETIRPFLTMFADFSIKTLLSLDDDLNRRLFFILDEFGELGKIGTIVPLLTGSRSKGGAGLILIQDTSRINTIYGKDGCSTIVNSCGNMISFAVKKTEADFASECFGSMEIKRTEESKSMGVDNISDSISISHQTVEKRLVMPSEVTNIPTLNFYIQLSDYPVSKDKLDIVSYEKKAQSYIGREDLLFKSSSSQETQSTSGQLSHKEPMSPEIQQVVIEDDVPQQVGDGLFSETNPSRINQADYFGELQPTPQTGDLSKSTLSEIKDEIPVVEINESENKNNPNGLLF